MRRRLMLKSRAGVSPVLPAEYQRVEWIGHAKNTALVFVTFPNLATTYIGKVVADLAITGSHANNPVVFGGYTSGSSSNPFFDLNGAVGGIPCTPTLNSLQDITQRTEYVMTPNNGVKNSDNTGYCALGWSNSHFTAELKAYGLIVYDTSNTELLNCVPCYRKADIVIGLYDFVQNRFFEVKGSWTKGADI